MGFSTLASTLGDGANSLLGWLLEAWRKSWSLLSKTEHTCAALAACRGRNEELREDGMLDGYIMPGRRLPDYVPWGSLKDISFTKVRRNMLVSGALTPKNSVLAFLWRPELMVREQPQSWAL